MTRAELKTLITTCWVDDENKGYFTDPILNIMLNNAQRQVQKLLILAGQNYYPICVTTPVFQDQKEYVQPVDFQSIRRIFLVTAGFGTTNPTKHELEDYTMRQDALAPYKGTPVGYYLRKNRIGLTPTPVQSGWYLEMEYNYLVADMTADGDIPDVPIEFHEMVALVAAYDCFIKDDRVPSNLTKKLGTYEETLDEMAASRTATGPRKVVVTDW